MYPKYTLLHGGTYEASRGWKPRCLCVYRVSFDPRLEFFRSFYTRLNFPSRNHACFPNCACFVQTSRTRPTRYQPLLGKDVSYNTQGWILYRFQLFFLSLSSRGELKFSRLMWLICSPPFLPLSWRVPSWCSIFDASAQPFFSFRCCTSCAGIHIC